MKTFINLLDRPIAFQRCLVDITGSVTAALLLSQAIYWSKRTTAADGWWYKTQKEWEEETGMTRRELDTAKRAAAKFLLCQRRGVPAKCFYTIDQSAVWNALSSVQTRLAESAKLDCTKAPNSIGVNRQTTNTETTTENTSDIPAKRVVPETEHAKFIRLWTEWYPKRYGHPYKVNGGRDGIAVKNLVTTKTADELIKIVFKAWKAAKLDPVKNFYCNKLVNIWNLDTDWNSINAELANASAPPPQQNGF